MSVYSQHTAMHIQLYIQTGLQLFLCLLRGGGLLIEKADPTSRRLGEFITGPQPVSLRRDVAGGLLILSGPLAEKMSGVEFRAQQQLTLSVVNDTTKSFGMAMNGQNRVCNIATDGLAHEAGIRLGDTLLTFNEKDIDNEATLFEAMRQTGNGEKVTFSVQRKEVA